MPKLIDPGSLFIDWSYIYSPNLMFMGKAWEH